MNPASLTLVCFAVKEEAAYFRPRASGEARVRTLVTGMGRQNAEAAFRGALALETPSLVLTCGFAGGLRPDLLSGTVVFSAETAAGLAPGLIAAGAIPARFHCSTGVATTAKEKLALRETTRADAVEMESGTIAAICREHGIACGIIRVILDVASEDLPLDFNRLMTERQQMDYGKLALTLLKSPGKVAGLLRLQKQSRAAAEKLGKVLEKITLG